MARKRKDDAPALPGMTEPPAKPHYAGHRERLRERFMKGGAAGLHDYELLELILFRAIPRRDVKPLAKDLLTRFGDVAGVLTADPDRLREVPGLGEAAVVDLRIIEAAALRLSQAKALGREVLSSWSAVMAYCKASMARNPVEEFRVLFLDRKNTLITDEVLGTGTIDQVPVYTREVVKRALAHNASAIVLLHNHPSGDPTPSRADIAMTKKIVDATAAVDIKVHDHVIIGRELDASFRSLGLL